MLPSHNRVNLTHQTLASVKILHVKIGYGDFIFVGWWFAVRKCIVRVILDGKAGGHGSFRMEVSQMMQKSTLKLRRRAEDLRKKLHFHEMRFAVIWSADT